MLTATRMTRRFGDTVAVDDVSFQIARGEVFALLGPNGAGKTTTMRMLAGLIAPSSGGISIDGQPLHATAPCRAGIGLLTESPGLWDRLTVRRNLLTYARLHGVALPARAVDWSLDAFGLAERAAQPCGVLSKGLKQRVALARTLLHDPSLVLLDEPTSGLDPESARDVRQLILRLRDQKRAIVISTHNLDEAERLADRVAIIRTRLIASGTPADLRQTLFGSAVRIDLRRDARAFGAAIGSLGVAWQFADDGRSVVVSSHRPEGLDVPALVRRLVEEGADIEAVVPREPSLEDVYLRLVQDRQGTRP